MKHRFLARIRPAFCFLLLSGLALGTSVSATASSLRVGTFRCDATPPLGEPMIWATPLTKVEQPLLAKGVVLESGTNRCVLCALDWCLLCNQSEWSFRQAIAEGAGTSPQQVAIQCVHQHAAPYADEGAAPLLDGLKEPLPRLSQAFLDDLRRRLASAVRDAVKQAQTVDQVGTAETKVEKIASERRLHDQNGRVIIRYSTGAKDPKMASAPEGDIDPVLKTITFARGGKPVARLHYYATHPQTFCCDGRASSDFVGLARETIEQEENVFQVYFTGCAGNVTAGKYSDGSPEAFKALTERLETAMRAAAQNTRFHPVKKLLWRTESVSLPLRADKPQVASESRAWLEDPGQTQGLRVFEGAMRLSFVSRLDRPVQVSSLQIGKIHIVHLPGEPMIDFQFFAQRLKPGAFVAVAGYGDCGTSYICTDKAIAEGAYEPSASNVGKGSEGILKKAIAALLGERIPK